MRVVTLFYLTTFAIDIEQGYTMLTIFLQGLKILMVSTIIVFIIQTLRLSWIAHKADPKCRSYLNSIRIALVMPWLTRSPNPVRAKLIYYFELISGKMYSEYKQYLTKIIKMVKVKCIEDPTDPKIQSTVIDNFTRECVIVENLMKANSCAEFERLVYKSSNLLTHLINKDLRQIIEASAEHNLAEEYPAGYSIIASIVKASNLHNLDTNTIIIVSLDYLQHVDLERLYRCG